jgi:nanoRNase/pAp phosphatase (c-di-AMP/oligoRNAs hydrolase)
MDHVMLEKIKELLAQNVAIGIAVGKNPGVDEMAAALALYLSLSETGKKISVVCPTDTIVELSSLVGIDKVKKSFEGGEKGDLTVTFPYKEGEIEKISYTLEEGKLNILVKAGENGLSFNEKDIEYKREGSAPGLVFVVGTPRISDLGTAFDMETLKDSKVINIDYKPENQGFGDIPLLGASASSVSELMANFLSSLNLKMDEDIASNLMAGIVAATDNFQSSSTSTLAFETAATLMKHGAVRKAKIVLSDNEVDAFFSPKPEPKKEMVREEKKIDENNPPDDWLAPKIYKGSTNV